MREIRLGNNTVYFIGESRVDEIRQSMRLKADDDISQLDVMERVRRPSFDESSERELFDNLCKSYAAANRKLKGTAVIDAEGGAHGNQWCYRDSSAEPCGSVQSLVDQIERHHNYVGVIVIISNPKEQRLLSQKSILFYPKDKLSRQAKSFHISDAGIYVPGLGEESPYTLDTDIERMARTARNGRR
jgi:hypothetical protein